MKEEEISKSIASFIAEAEVINRCVKFLEDSWGIQSSFARQKEKQVDDELEQCTKRHSDLIVHLLSAYVHELQNLVTCFRVLVRRLKSSEESTANIVQGDDESHVTSIAAREGLEREYKDLEVKLVTAFNLVESMKQSFTQNEDIPRKDVQEVNRVFLAFKKIKEEFELLERPKTVSVTDESSNPNPKPNPKQQLSWLKLSPKNSFRKKEITKKVIDGQQLLDSDDSSPEAEASQHDQTQTSDIIDWEFDAVLDNN